MNETQATAWLRKSVRNQIAASALGSLAMLAAGIAILVVTWGFAYIVSLFAFGFWLGFHHWAHAVGPSILIPSLFWGNARTSGEYLSEYSVTTGTASDAVVKFYLPGVGMVSNVNPLAPDTLHTGVKMITDILYSGPRVVTAAVRLIAECFRLRRVDLGTCGAVLAVLFTSGRKMSFQQIVDAVPGLNPVVVFPQLHEIPGVIFLVADPPGLTLSSELREEISRYCLENRTLSSA